MRKLLCALTFAGMTLTGQSAFALPTINVTYAGSANFGAGGVGYYNGSIAPNPSGTNLVAVGIGGDSFTTTNHSYDFSATGQFNTWCVDIFHWLIGGTVTYNVATSTDLATVLGSTRTSQLLLLANDVYSTVDTANESAAFQLAVWAVAFGTANGSGHYAIDTTNSGFRVNSATQNAAYGQLANTWLSNLGAAPDTGNYKLTYLNDGTLNNTQDMVVFTSVSEPGPFSLLGIALAGMFWLNRRSRKTSAD